VSTTQPNPYDVDDVTQEDESSAETFEVGAAVPDFTQMPDLAEVPADDTTREG